ncbi:MAG: hypothetical protein JSW27_18610 [Phycisphaerales bacterium]|nr:MAG: hypothetical protein JSW27_18610 [Phycisphaerales bacterium]
MENRRTLQRVATSLLLLTWMSHAVLADRIIYVDGQAPGANNGSNWTDAYICLQNALESATAGDEIRVAQGTYRPDQRTVILRSGDNRYIQTSRDGVDETFRMPEAVVIRGGYGGYGHPRPDARNVEAYPSILTGDLRGNDADLENLEWQGLTDFVKDGRRVDNCHTVVTAFGVTDSSVLDGFTITGGRGFGVNAGVARTRRGDTSSPPYPTADPATDGAGALITLASPRFIRCTFYRNTTHASNAGASGGSGAACEDASPTFQDCSFVENIALADHAEAWSYGGGVLLRQSTPTLIDCAFTGNMTIGIGQLSAGGAIACVASNPHLTGCSFVGNQAVGSSGGAVYNTFLSDPVLTDCYFERNSAHSGGAFYSAGECNPSLTGCTFWANIAFDAYGAGATVEADPNDEAGSRSRGRGGETETDEQEDDGPDGQGGALYNAATLTTVTSCRFLGNAAGFGGAASGRGEMLLVNCLFSGNTAKLGAAVNAVSSRASTTITGCTFTANHASQRGNAYYGWANSTAQFSNCILWEETPVVEGSSFAQIDIAYSDVRGGGYGQGSINADPRLHDPAGADGVPGTLDDDLRLSVGSPCIDAGSRVLLPEWVTTDLAGQPRVVNAKVDMGAYEFDGPYNYYVDAVYGDDAQEGYSPRHAFATIQRGIEAASDGYTVVVLPGIYTEEINFDGKAITVAGSKGGAVLEAPGGYGVSFYTAERSTSILKNLAIQNCDVGIFIAGTSPTIRNMTLANNEFGIAAYAGAVPDISNCILWDNLDGDLFDCTATYSCIEQGSEGEGNIRVDPLFADVANGDYHLLSERGRFVPNFGLWAFDEVTSPCVDAGNPWLSPGAERMPNGARINMGAFGGTPEASLSEWPLRGDINRDGIVDGNDLDILNEQWLEELPGRAGSTPATTNSLQPNPPRWDIDGQPHEVHGGGGASDYYVEMTAAEVVSPDGPVEYFFECDLSDFDSGWQVERTYTVLVGRTGQGLLFRVRARDSSGNMTEWTEWARAMMEGED